MAKIPRADNVKTIIRSATVIAVLIMLVAVGWTAFFMLQILDIIPSIHDQAAADIETAEVESVNSALLGRVTEHLQQKTARPVPDARDLRNPFVIPPEPAPAPSAAENEPVDEQPTGLPAEQEQ